MIERRAGDILAADTEALVNTVNCRGVMGRGVALLVKRAYPEVFRSYRAACEQGEVQPGRMHVVPIVRVTDQRYVINFPTKRHWKARARLQDIEVGLAALVAEIKAREIRSVAIPALGCGNGGLDWNVVRPLIEAAFAELPNVRVLMFDPPDWGDSDGNNEQAISLAPEEAALLLVMDRYLSIGYGLAVVDIEKLVYLLQVDGVPFGCRFTDGDNGPAAQDFPQFWSTLQDKIGDWPDGRRPGSAALLPSNLIRAARANVGKSHASVENVCRLIEGFESPYGLELLASMHWYAVNGPSDSSLSHVLADLATGYRRGWAQPAHVQIARQHLVEHQWLQSPAVAQGATAGVA
jgi:O-acetyl-ADP-ribose deacetylase (regulator of RNase III)